MPGFFNWNIMLIIVSDIPFSLLWKISNKMQVCAKLLVPLLYEPHEGDYDDEEDDDDDDDDDYDDDDDADDDADDDDNADDDSAAADDDYNDENDDDNDDWSFLF